MDPILSCSTVCILWLRFSIKFIFSSFTLFFLVDLTRKKKEIWWTLIIFYLNRFSPYIYLITFQTKYVAYLTDWVHLKNIFELKKDIRRFGVKIILRKLMNRVDFYSIFMDRLNSSFCSCLIGYRNFWIILCQKKCEIRT